MEKKAERLVSSVAPGAVCTAQEWDRRIDCSIWLPDGSVAAEMIPLRELNEKRLLECAERLQRRAQGEKVRLVNERRPPLVIGVVPWPWSYKLVEALALILVIAALAAVLFPA